MVNCWAKLKNGNGSKISFLLCSLMESLSKKSDLFHFKWLDHVKGTLDQAGFSDIWEVKNTDTLWLKSIFSQRSHAIFQQKWQAKVNQNSQCTFYKTLKNTLKMDDYLRLLEPCHRYSISKFQTRTNNLPTTKARFNEPADVTCPLCSANEIGNEPHYLFNCDFFRNDRKKLLPETFVVYANCNDISEMFEELMDKSDLVRVASFMRKVMSKFKYESTHPKENAPKKPKTIKYTRSGRAIRPPTTLTFWFPYIATFYTYCLSLSFVQCYFIML